MDIYFLILGIFIYLNGVDSKSKARKFPQNFWFGASSAAFQIEGGWQEDGKAPSIWDVVVHSEQSPVKDHSTADVAADSYHLYKKDVQIAKELGLSFYRFSMSWPRILPNGFADRINQIAIQYYDNLLDELIAHNITPIVTIYHWDLPSNLQKLGGWTNPLIINWFLDYAKILFDKFGTKVKQWITINDPKEICHGGYGSTSKAPMINMPGTAEYMCAKNILLAHAIVYHAYDEQFRRVQNGMIGISISFRWFEPSSSSEDDHQAAIDAKMFDWGIYTNPIFGIGGDFPLEVKRNVRSKSAEQNYPWSRLPELSTVEVGTIRRSADFLGVNSFTTKLVYRDASVDGMYPVPSYMDDMGVVLVKDPSWTQSIANWSPVPWGFFKLLVELKNTYDNPPIIVTENGWPTRGGLLDEDRISYLRRYLNALLDAVDEGCDIRGYSVWSLIDNFEWFKGYTEMYGLYEVDFTSPEKTRTPRKSALMYKEVIKTNILDPDYEPEKFLVEAP
ncbi:myrosinase 1-like [Anticarsia gemmatalis]|uniref:myrosinase 1-like n=1 Tax=Anticarsia gemmatalis TaxID=129554 RepID=UPI003F768FA7